MGIGIIAVTANLVSFGLLLGVEALISKFRWIPVRSPEFRYMRDRNLFRVGDAVGLSIVSLAIGLILDQAGFPPVWYLAAAIIVASLLNGVMHTVWLKQSERDSAYPSRGISLLGILHFPYWTGHVIWILLGLWHITDLSVLGFIFLEVVGGAVWAVTLLRDGKQNKEG